MSNNFEFRKLEAASLNAIASWVYATGETLFMQPYFDCQSANRPLRGPADCEGFAVYLNQQLIGLFEFSFSDERMILGLALSPLHVGKGLSSDFILAGIRFGIEHYDYRGSAVFLEVEKSNIAAVKAYTKVGFSLLDENGDSFTLAFSLDKMPG
ncbi:MAG: GNAT family N-acetyltransferase [Bacteroidetes bacterium]|nr:MAG: GNAT family N-acetyltransferase [Bacteroidota bacterium]